MKALTAALLLLAPLVAHAATARDTVENFYRKYLSPGKKPQIEISKSFRKLTRENEKVCKEKAGTDICGWGADGDIYLNAQEYDPKLTFDSSGATVTEAEIGTVRVKLNVYPSLGKAYDREITFRMIEEGGRWVVDDIVYAGGDSSRKHIREETDLFRKTKK